MASEMPEVELGPLCLKIGSGATPRGGDKVYLDKGDVALIRSQNVRNDGFKTDGLVYIDAEHANQLANVTVEPHDVLLNITGDSVARCCQVDPRVLPSRVNQHVAIIRPRSSELSPRFLRYFLVSPRMQSQMLGWAHAGATRNALTKGMIESFKVPKPPISVQSRIADVLGKMDDKIELNRRMNRTLEKTAAALFKSWFIDFDPVHAKAEGRNPGLPAEIADLFPDSIVESELGPIPKGWHVAAVDQVAEIVKGRSYKSAELQPSDAALVTLKSFLRGGGYREDGLKPYTGRYTPEQVVQPGEMIVAMTDVTQNAEVIGRPAIVMPDARYGVLVASLDTSIVRPTSGTVSTPFLYGLFSTETFRAHTYAHSSGTTVLHLAKNAIPSFTFPCPTEQVQNAFVSFIGPLRARQQMMHGQNRRLAGLRDTLLPKLMSGEIELALAESDSKEVL